MNKEIFSILAKSGIKNDIALPVWIYKKEQAYAAGKKYLRVYLFNREFTDEKPDFIEFESGGKYYDVSEFPIVSQYGDVNIVGAAFEIPMESNPDDFNISFEIIKGQKYVSYGINTEYEAPMYPQHGPYIAEKLGVDKDCVSIRPVKNAHYWQCSCGRIHSNDKTMCGCGLSSQFMESVLGFDLKAHYTQDYLSVPVTYDLSKDFDENIENYLTNFTNKYSMNPDAVRQGLDIEKERNRYEDLLEEKKIQDAKTKKKNMITSIVLGSVAAFLLIWYLAANFLIPQVKYWSAQSSVKKDNYEKALSLFEDLAEDEFRDSKAKIKETKYLYAAYQAANNNYDEALSLYRALKGAGYEDSTAKFYETQNKKAQYLYSEKDYKEAYEYLKSFDNTSKSKFKDYYELYQKSGYEYAKELFAEERYPTGVLVLETCTKNAGIVNEDIITFCKESIEVISGKNDYDSAYRCMVLAGTDNLGDTEKEVIYNYASKILEEGKYDEAEKLFTEIKDYKDSKTKVNEAKYQYVIAHKTSTDTMTYSYLKELKSAKYKDSAKIYNSLYALKATVVINNYSSGMTDVSSVSRYDTIYARVKLSGGNPDTGKQKITIKVYWPDGGVSTDTVSVGIGGTTDNGGYYFNKPYLATKGTITAKAFDSNGNVIGSDTCTMN